MVYYLELAHEQSRDTSFALSTALVYQQTELGYSLISATIPNLKSFIMSFDTGMMMNVAASTESRHDRNSHRYARHVPFSVNQSIPRDLDSSSHYELGTRLRPDAINQHEYSQHKTKAWNVKNGDISGELHNRDGAIQRDFQWEVEYRKPKYIRPQLE